MYKIQLLLGPLLEFLFALAESPDNQHGPVNSLSRCPRTSLPISSLSDSMHVQTPLGSLVAVLDIQVVFWLRELFHPPDVSQHDLGKHMLSFVLNL